MSIHARSRCFLKNQCKALTDGNPKMFLLPLEEVGQKELVPLKLRRCKLGETHSKKEKVVMMVGAAGAGKTTLINGIANYMFGVRWKSNFRFKLLVDEDDGELKSPSESLAQWVTAYTIYKQSASIFPYSLTIIDTPGFGSNGGIVQDKKTIDKLTDFFRVGGNYGITHINAVCFVVPATSSALNQTQQFLFDSVMSLFGKDIEHNMFMMATFDDTNNPPELAECAISFLNKESFKINIPALFAGRQKSQTSESEAGVFYGLDTDDVDSDEEQENECDASFRRLWEFNKASFKDFFQNLQETQNVSILQTKNVLEERKSLQTYIESIQMQLQAGLNKLAQLKKEIEVLREHLTCIEQNKDFEYEYTDEKVTKENLKPGIHTTTCLKCNFTCHENCAYGNDSDKHKCCSMIEGQCVKCPQKCHWELHKNTPYILRIQQVTALKTSSDIKDKYEQALGQKLSTENLIKHLKNEFDAVQQKVVFLSDQIRRTIMRLEEISLKPNPLSTVGYFDILIASEQNEHRRGWESRISQLEEARAQADILFNVSDVNFDPFADSVIQDETMDFE